MNAGVASNIRYPYSGLKLSEKLNITTNVTKVVTASASFGYLT